MLNSQRTITIQPARVAKILGSLVAVLVLASIAGQISKYFGGHGRLLGFVPEFYLDNENNIPTYFSSILLFISALLLAIIAGFKKKDHDEFTVQWAILSIVFLFMSLDEVASLHELLIRPMRKLFGITQGPFYFAWVIPGMALILVFAALYCRFLFCLPRKSRLLFSIAAIVYLIGALGFDMIGGHYVALYGKQNFAYTLIASLEETLEMIGVIVFIYALLEEIKSNLASIRIDIV